MRKLLNKLKEKTKTTFLLSFVLVFICTLFTSAGQIFWKLGSNNVTGAQSFILNPFVISGFVLYGIATLLYLLALRYGQLSIVLPLFSISFIWTAILSKFVLHETVTPSKIIGIIIIGIGITFLGIGADKK